MIQKKVANICETAFVWYLRGVQEGMNLTYFISAQCLLEDFKA